jgi:hypothetical protein
MSPNTRPLSPRSIHTAGEGAERSKTGEGLAATAQSAAARQRHAMRRCHWAVRNLAAMPGDRGRLNLLSGIGSLQKPGPSR